MTTTTAYQIGLDHDAEMCHVVAVGDAGPMCGDDDAYMEEWTIQMDADAVLDNAEHTFLKMCSACVDALKAASNG